MEAELLKSEQTKLMAIRIAIKAQEEKKKEADI